ncbi:MAG: ABC transporter permease [Balneola sp.]
MFSNYIKIALRNLKKHKIDSFISLSGLSIGLCCCIILIMYVRFEWSYDNFHENKDSIYRLTVQTVNPFNEQARKSTVHSHPQSIALREELPEIESIIKIEESSAEVLKDGKYVLESIKYTDQEFLSSFSFPLLYGNSSIVLNRVDHIVLSESAAIKYFGETNVVGKLLTIRLRDEPQDFIISGIAKDVPKNSSIQFDFLLPFENRINSATPDQQKRLRENWYIGFYETWITLKNGASKEELIAKFPAFLERHYGSDFIKRNKIEYDLQPLSEVYFNEDYRSGVTLSSNKTYSLILGSIALIVLIIAGINFMSLTLSRATSRYHEVGIRKSVGALKHQIKLQVVGEVFITCFIAIFIGIALAEFFTPFAYILFQKELDLSFLTDLVFWVSIAGLLLILTLITSLYPAIQISRKTATSLFSGNTTASKIALGVKGLVIVQFSLAIALMIGTYVMQSQINYILKKDLGFNPDNVIAVELKSELKDAGTFGMLFSEEALKINGVLSTSLTAGEYRDYSEYGVVDIGMAQTMSTTTLTQLGDGIASEAVDAKYLETMGINLVNGSNFSEKANSYSSNEIVVNQAFVNAMGWESPIDMILDDKSQDQNWVGPFDGKKVIGVIENYHFKSLYSSLQPMVLKHIQGIDQNPGTILIRINSDSMSETITKLEMLWNRIASEEAFNFAFLDDMLQKQYNEEIRWNRIIKAASIISFLLACFGLFGLSALAANKRIKEVGIRKVFGASIKNLIALVSKDFVVLVLVAFIVSVPLTWYFSNKWLTNFSYKIELGLAPFIFGGLVALSIAIVTISWQTFKTASANPIDSLKSE